MTTSTGGLVLEGSYSFSFDGVSEMPSDSELAQIDKANEKFLKTSATWQDPVEVEELDSVGLELRRQDMKINLLMDMVSELLMRQTELPPSETIKLTPTGVEFPKTPERLQVEGLGRVSLYILPALPKALQFVGKLQAGDQDNCLRLEFLGTSTAVQDQIEKLLFTHHRRSIAQEHANSKAPQV